MVNLPGKTNKSALRRNRSIQFSSRRRPGSVVLIQRRLDFKANARWQTRLSWFQQLERVKKGGRAFFIGAFPGGLRTPANQLTGECFLLWSVLLCLSLHCLCCYCPYRSANSSNLAVVKKEEDSEWCSEFSQDNYVEEDFKMVETSTQPSPRSSALAGSHFFGSVLLGEGFQPVYKPSRGSPGSTPGSHGSLFTIDSILAPRPKPTSPQRPLVHPGPLHLGHIAAAASGFGATSADFLGESIIFFEYSIFIHSIIWFIQQKLPIADSSRFTHFFSVIE